MNARASDFDRYWRHPPHDRRAAAGAAALIVACCLTACHDSTPTEAPRQLAPAPVYVAPPPVPSASLVPAPSPVPFQMALAKHSITGSVSDAYFGMVPNARVGAWVATDAGSGYLWWSTHTDRVGRFAGSNVPDSHITVFAAANGFVQQCAVSADVHSDAAVDIELTDVRTLDALSPPAPRSAKGHALTGTTFELDHGVEAPLPGADIWAETGLDIVVARTRSDQLGHFYLCNLPPNVTLHVSKRGFVASSVGPVDPSGPIAIELERFLPSPGDRVTVVGYQDGWRYSDPLEVGGVRLAVTSSTIKETGTWMGINIKLQVEGIWNANGILEATKIRALRRNHNRMAAVVESVDAASGSFEMLGVTMRTDASTRFHDHRAGSVAALRASDIAIGDYLDVRGAESPMESGAMLVAAVERRDAVEETELRGYVEYGSYTAQQFSLLGVTVTTSGGTGFRLPGDYLYGQYSFYDDLKTGSFVRVRGTKVGATEILATEVWYEDCSCGD